MMNFARENTGSSQALTRQNFIHISGESPENWTVTLLLHYGEVHSRHDRSTSYRSARLAWLTNAKEFFLDCTS